MMMIAGFAVTAGVAGHLLDPYSPQRLVRVALGVSVLALVLTLVALRGVEGGAAGPQPAALAEPAELAEPAAARHPAFREPSPQRPDRPLAGYQVTR